MELPTDFIAVVTFVPNLPKVPVAFAVVVAISAIDLPPNKSTTFPNALSFLKPLYTAPTAVATPAIPTAKLPKPLDVICSITSATLVNPSNNPFTKSDEIKLLAIPCNEAFKLAHLPWIESR